MFMCKPQSGKLTKNINNAYAAKTFNRSFYYKIVNILLSRMQPIKYYTVGVMYSKTYENTMQEYHQS